MTRWVALVLGALGILMACRSPSDRPVRVTGTHRPPGAVLLGCTFVSTAGCEVQGGDQLTLAVTSAYATDVQMWQGDELVGTTTFESGSSSTPISLRPFGGEASLRLVFSTPRGDVQWQKNILQVDLPRAWERALRERARGELDRARAALSGLPRQEVWQTRGNGLQARIALMRGDAAAAEALFHQTIARHRSRGRHSEEARDSFALSYLLTQQGRVAESTLVLDAAEEATSSWGEAHAWGPYYRALVADAEADMLTAMEQFDLSLATAQRLGMTQHAQDVRRALAKRLQRLGRFDEAQQHLEGLLASTPDGCRRAAMLNDAGWLALLQTEHRPDPTRELEARRHLDEALAIFTRSCKRAADLRMARLNRAWLAVREGDVGLADELLEGVASTEASTSDERIWEALVHGELAMGSDAPHAAIEHYEAAEEMAAGALVMVGRWRALLGRGRAMAALGREREAEAAWRSAEDLLDEATAMVPVGAGRASFLAQRDGAAIALVEQLVARDEAAAAERVARRARARSLASLQRLDRIEALRGERKDAFRQDLRHYQALREELSKGLAQRWSMSQAELAGHDANLSSLRERLKKTLASAYSALDEPKWEPGPGDVPGVLRLTFFPRAEQGRWWVFATDDHGTASFDLPSPMRGDAAAALITPLAEALTRADRLRVLAYGAWQNVDIHALPWRGKPLVAALPVHYAIDMTPPVSVASGLQAVVIANPTEDLPHAEAEGRRVVQSLEPAWSVDALIGLDATAPRLVASLSTASLLHFAGHGSHRPHRMASELRLAEQDALSVSDILASSRTPHSVVLSGCLTAGGDEQSPLAVLNVATAFLLGGSRVVVGTSRPVTDGTGAQLAQLLYRGAEEKGWRLDHAFRRAQLNLAEQQPGADWSAYRLLTH